MTSIRAVYAAAKQNNLEQDAIRDVALKITGQRSLKGHSSRTYREIVNAMGGFKENGKPKRNDPRLNKVRALWIAGYNLGVINDKTDKAMFSFIKRQTGIDHVNWVQSVGDFERVIEALKSWLTREAGINWKTSYEPFSPYQDLARITYALIKLRRKALGTPSNQTPLQEMIDHIMPNGQKPSLAQWYRIQNNLGAELRRLSETYNAPR